MIYKAIRRHIIGKQSSTSKQIRHQGKKAHDFNLLLTSKVKQIQIV
jgi:hypothetical protein